MNPVVIWYLSPSNIFCSICSSSSSSSFVSSPSDLLMPYSTLYPRIADNAVLGACHFTMTTGGSSCTRVSWTLLGGPRTTQTNKDIQTDTQRHPYPRRQTMNDTYRQTS